MTIFLRVYDSRILLHSFVHSWSLLLQTLVSLPTIWGTKMLHNTRGWNFRIHENLYPARSCKFHLFTYTVTVHTATWSAVRVIVPIYWLVPSTPTYSNECGETTSFPIQPVTSKLQYFRIAGNIRSLYQHARVFPHHSNSISHNLDLLSSTSGSYTVIGSYMFLLYNTLNL